MATDASAWLTRINWPARRVATLPVHVTALPERAMNKTWVLVADSEKARVFEFDRRKEPWKETACFVNPDAVHGPTSERPPRVQESVGGARHAIEAHTDP